MRNKTKPPPAASSSSWRDVLLVHPAAEEFEMMSLPERIELGQDIKKNGLQQPIVIIERAVPRADGSYHVSDPPQTIVLDGRNKLEAMELVGIEVIDRKGQLAASVARVVIDPEEIDPYGFVISANVQRRHLTCEEKRALVAKLLKRTPDKSDRQIAETAHVSPTTVGAERAKLEQAGEVSKLDTRTDAKGIKQPASKPPKTPKSAPPRSTPGQAIVSAEERKAAFAAEEAQLDTVCQKASFAGPKAEPDRTSKHHAVANASSRVTATLAPKPAKPTSAMDIVAAWYWAPLQERTRAINSIGLEPLRAAIPPPWIPLLVGRAQQSSVPIPLAEVEIETGPDGYPVLPALCKRH